MMAKGETLYSYAINFRTDEYRPRIFIVYTRQGGVVRSTVWLCIVKIVIPLCVQQVAEGARGEPAVGAGNRPARGGRRLGAKEYGGKKSC